MSVQSEIDRIKGNVAGAYSAVSDMGGEIPEQQNSDNLEAAVRSIPTGGGGPSNPLDPVEVYNSTRPADWLAMPEPQDDEMYLLFHIPDGVSSLLAFTVTCTGNYTVALGTVTDGQFSPQSSVSLLTGAKYEAELLADDYGDITSNGLKQVMVKISGTDINTWEPSSHSKKTSPANFCRWNIVEISCRLPKGTTVACGNPTLNKALTHLQYFSWHGENAVVGMSHMFHYCYSLIAVQNLDTSKVTDMTAAFNDCNSLAAIPNLDTSKVTNMNSMFANCYSLVAIPDLNTSKVTNMGSFFLNCRALAAFPNLDTAKNQNFTYMFSSCGSLTAIPQLNISTALSSTSDIFRYCYSLSKITLYSTRSWSINIDLSGCSLSHQALIVLFNSLSTTSSVKNLTLTGNPGVSELTEEEKAIATAKNWTLTL